MEKIKKHLYLSDFDGFTEKEVRNHLITTYSAGIEKLNALHILIAYESEDSYDGQSWFLFQKKHSGDLFEMSASHCSCYGFEDQFDLEEITLEFLKSSRFRVPISSYSYGGDSDGNRIRDFIESL